MRQSCRRAFQPPVPISALPSQTPVSALPASILLIEEYKALAIAFGSALKKFAPNSEIRVVGSLPEADALLSELTPTLLVIDCDPPPRHSLKFFNRLRTLLPDARVLIVAAENAEEFADQDAFRPALEFIKKPFELEKFGAVVQKLLHGNAADPRMVRHLRLLDLILLHAITEAELVLRVDAAGGRSGEIHFADGRITHAAVIGQSGLEALRTMLTWKSVRFSEGERPHDPPRTIHGEWAEILRRVLPAALPEKEVAEVKPTRQRASRVSAKRTIVVVDDTELLLQFVEDALVTAHPEWEIITALSGFDGLKSVAADKPDLLLLDYDLPDITGADVCEKLLDNEKTGRVPVIMMSGHIAEMTETAAHFGNVVATIAKPFLAGALVELVEETLRASSRSRAPFAKKTSTVASPLPSRNGGEHMLELAEEIPVSIQDPSPAVEEEIEQAAMTSRSTVIAAPDSARARPLLDVSGELYEPPSILRAPIPAAIEIPAGFKIARSTSVVLSLPVEAMALDFSAHLRVREIRVRQNSSNVWLHLLPASMPQSLKHGRPLQLVKVQTDADGQIDFVHLAPFARPEDLARPRYRLTLDAGQLVPGDNSHTIRFAPPATTPLRFELLALFELCALELSPQIEVQQLILKMRDKRVRATLAPDAMNVGATFAIADLSLTRSGTIDEMRLIAV